MKLRRTTGGQLYDHPMSPLELNKMVKNAGMRVIERKGTYYLPPRVSPQSRLYDIFVRVSKFIEVRNLLPYVGLYQVCLLRPTKKH